MIVCSSILVAQQGPILHSAYEICRLVFLVAHVTYTSFDVTMQSLCASYIGQQNRSAARAVVLRALQVSKSCSRSCCSRPLGSVLVGDSCDNTVEWWSFSVLFSVCSFVHRRCPCRSCVSAIGIGTVVADPFRRRRSCHRWQSLGRRPFQIRRFDAIPRCHRCFSIPVPVPSLSHANLELDSHFRANRSILANSFLNLGSLWQRIPFSAQSNVIL